jgi:hypothetical protein
MSLHGVLLSYKLSISKKYTIKKEGKKLTLLQAIDARAKQELIKVGIKEPRIFVTNWAGHDFSGALSWTTLTADEAFVAITNGDINTLNIDRLLYNIRAKLTDFQRFDYLLISGHPLPFALALHILISKFSEVRILIWDRRQHRYHLRYVSQESFQLPLDPNNEWPQKDFIEPSMSAY